MTWDEIILIIGIILIILFSSEIIRVKLKPKTRLLVSLVSFIILMTLFIVRHHFSTSQLILLIAIAIMWGDSFYNRYKKYRQPNNPKN